MAAGEAVVPVRRLDSLTGMRFFAALLVALYHAGMWVEEVSTAPSGPFRFGYVGVSFFYVLSGFVLTWTWRPGSSIKFFYLRRFARIYPLHLVTTLAAGALALAGAQIRADPAVLPLHLTLTQAWALDNAVIFQWNGLSWSLSNEAFFYAVFPLLVLVFARRPRVLAAAGLAWLVVWGFVVLAVAPNLTIFLYTFPGYRVGEFAIGMACALAVKQGWRVPLGLWGGIGAAAAGYAAIWVGDRLTGYFFGRELWASHLLVVGGFALAVMAAAQTDLHGRRSWLRWWPLVRLGEWSYALYLVHYLVYTVGKPVREGLSWGERYGVVMALLVVAILCAGALYQLLERPVEKRLRDWGRARWARTGRTAEGLDRSLSQ